ncbi:oxygen-independent coproporphyrinogen III oxidase [bacterium]|nr:MAG: oxygen-independent coproporphyrinogen III oxidase [bacterium]
MKQFDHIDLNLLRKYSRQGPRYTSYPPAPVFSTAFGPQSYLDEIQKTNASGAAADLSLYFHHPFCDTLCYFCGCTMLVTRSRSQISQYNSYLEKEIDMIAPMIAENRRVSQLHWGGGTPSYLTPEEIRHLGEFTRSRFNYSEDIEAGVELDPRELMFDHMQAFRESGFNRASMGVQDFDPQVQKAVNRVQPESITRDAVSWCRQLGFKSINLDLIYGLPFQTLASFEKTVDIVLDINPDRIAVFNYAHVPWLKKHQKLLLEETMPSPELKLEIFKMTIEKLIAAGYWNIGMDHFAKYDDEMAQAQREHTLYRNFQGYSTKAGCDLYGFGMSAIGQFNQSYQQNTKGIAEYYQLIDAGKPATHAGYRMTADDHIRKAVIMGLMCDLELDSAAIEKQFDITFEDYFYDALIKLKEFIDDGLVSIGDSKISVHGLGRLVIRNIAMCFDAHIEKMMKEKPVFSKTV